MCYLTAPVYFHVIFRDEYAMQFSERTLQSIGLLVLRIVFSLTLIYGHGWGKLIGWAERSSSFPDPIGLGSPVSLALAIGAEVFCALLLLVGLGTRLVALPIIITFVIVTFVVHSGDAFGKVELPLLFLAAFTTLAFTGAGDFSLDAVLKKRRNASAE